MKTLCIGDLHMTLETLEFVERTLCGALVSLIERHQIQRLVFLGDILDNRKGIINMFVLNSAVRFFDTLRARTHVYVLVGNHDYIDPHQFLSTAHWMRALTSRTQLDVIDSARRIGDAVFCPYVPEGRLQEALDTCAWRDARIVFAHQAIRGCRVRAGIVDFPDTWDATWPPLVSGHIHSRQVLEEGVWYPGAIQTGTGVLIEETGSPQFISLFSSPLQESHMSSSFLDAYRANVLQTGDVFTYCAAEHVLQGTSWDEENHLFVPQTRT